MIEKRVYGRINDKLVYEYTLTNLNNVSVSIIDYGATITSIKVPDSKGNIADVVLGYKNINCYLDNPECMGCTIAPNANRISKGLCEIDGTPYQLALNDNGVNNLHTHKDLSSSKRFMDVSLNKEVITFKTFFPNGEAGLPGNRDFKVSFELTNENELVIDYSLISDKMTVFNPTQHSYFNLAGHANNQGLNQYLKINADFFTPIDGNLIPTGEIRKVDDSPFDFRELKQLSKDFSLQDPQMKIALGYDHNYCLRNYDGTLKEACKLYDCTSGRLMICRTTQPGLQVYSANYVDRQDGKEGATYKKQSGIALETQFYPDTPNHKNFPSSIIEANKEVCYCTVFQFMW